MDVRVLDYIDDRLATSSDFDALDSLIENVKEQQDLLKKQVIEHLGSKFTVSGMLMNNNSA
jgi:N-acetylglutamate synthase-like GNAT family acetyltransferase